jgi:hypothetical protein
MGWARHVACVGRVEVHIGSWWENLREGDHVEDSGIDGSIIFKWIFEKWNGGGGMDCINLAQDWDRLWALVSAVMNPRVHKIGGVA